MGMLTFSLILFALIVITIIAFFINYNGFGSISLVITVFFIKIPIMGEFTGCGADQVIAFDKNLRVYQSSFLVVNGKASNTGNLRRQYEVPHIYFFSLDNNQTTVKFQVPFTITLGIVDSIKFINRQIDIGRFNETSLTLSESDALVRRVVIDPYLRKLEAQLQKEDRKSVV